MRIFKYHHPLYAGNTLADFINELTNEGVASIFDPGRKPSANIREEKDQYTIEIAAPGLNKSDFNIKIKDDQLNVKVEKPEQENGDNANFKRREFGYSSFSRSFYLPEDIEKETIKATYENGILTISIPKAEVAKEIEQVIEIS